MGRVFDLTTNEALAQRLRAEVLARAEAFAALHKGHDLRHSDHADQTQPFEVACHTCGEVFRLKPVIERIN